MTSAAEDPVENGFFSDITKLMEPKLYQDDYITVLTSHNHWCL